MSPIKLIIADDHQVLRDSLRAFLANYPEVAVVGESASGLETIEAVRNNPPDVLLLDLGMPNLSGLDILPTVRQIAPYCKVLVLSQHETPQYVLSALKMGAKGYLLKRAGGHEVVEAIRCVMNGGQYLHPDIVQIVIAAAVNQPVDSRDSSAVGDLTPRELDVLGLIGEGRTNKEIGHLLRITPKTVDKYRARLQEKLGVKTRAGLMRFALVHRFSDPK